MTSACHRQIEMEMKACSMNVDIEHLGSDWARGDSYMMAQRKKRVDVVVDI